MAIEILGFAIKPEISIGDITGIAALISSAFVFWFGYSRSRKSEQIKIAREINERIYTKSKKIIDIDEEIISVEDESRTREKLIAEIAAMSGMLEEIRYFNYLLLTHEIRDENTIRYYLPVIGAMLWTLEAKLLDMKEGHPITDLAVDTTLAAINDIKRSMEDHWWNDDLNKEVEKAKKAAESWMKGQDKEGKTDERKS